RACPGPSCADASAAWPPRCGACARPAMPAASWRWRKWCQPSLTRLPDLAADDLTRVANALALVRVGLAQLADVGRGLADQLLVDAGDREPRGRVDGERDAVRRRDHHGVAEPERELQRAALERDAVTDAVDLEPLLVASGDADEDVV